MHRIERQESNPQALGLLDQGRSLGEFALRPRNLQGSRKESCLVLRPQRDQPQSRPRRRPGRLPRNQVRGGGSKSVPERLRPFFLKT